MRICLSLILAAFVAACASPQTEAPATDGLITSPCDVDSGRLYANWKVNVVSKNPGKELMENYLSPPLRAEFMAAYNETPPQSHEDPANVAVWATKLAISDHLSGQTRGGTYPSGLVVFIDGDGCIIQTETVPLFVLDKWLVGEPYLPEGMKQS